MIDIIIHSLVGSSFVRVDYRVVSTFYQARSRLVEAVDTAQAVGAGSWAGRGAWLWKLIINHASQLFINNLLYRTIPFILCEVS